MPRIESSTAAASDGPGRLAALVGLVVHRLKELPRLGLGPVQLVLPAPGPPGVGRRVRGPEYPRRQLVPRRLHVLGAALDRVVVLVARHAHNVEEHLAKGVGHARLHGAQALGEVAVARTPTYIQNIEIKRQFIWLHCQRYLRRSCEWRVVAESVLALARREVFPGDS